jgi:hypothetical protein
MPGRRTRRSPRRRHHPRGNPDAFGRIASAHSIHVPHSPAWCPRNASICSRSQAGENGRSTNSPSFVQIDASRLLGTSLPRRTSSARNEIIAQVKGPCEMGTVAKTINVHAGSCMRWRVTRVETRADSDRGAIVNRSALHVTNPSQLDAAIVSRDLNLD